MTMILTDALKQLALQPGQSQRVRVGDNEFEIRRIDEEHDPGPMQTLWLQVGFSARAVTLLAARTAPQLPAPFHVAASDLASE